MNKIETLKKGDYFKLKESAKGVWVKDNYNRSTKKYGAYAFDDISKYREFKKGREVFTEF